MCLCVMVHVFVIMHLFVCDHACDCACVCVQMLEHVQREWRGKVVLELDSFSRFLVQVHGRVQLKELEVWHDVADHYSKLLPPVLAVVS